MIKSIKYKFILMLVITISFPVISSESIFKFDIVNSENQKIEQATIEKKVSHNNNWIYYPSYNNYAPNGIPDFDQRQDNWKDPTYQSYSFCGPTSVGNVFWYLDSVSSDPIGIPGDGIDIYQIVQDYNAIGEPTPGPLTDDHNFNNVNDLASPWDQGNELYGNELIEKIAWYVDTNGCKSGRNDIFGTWPYRMLLGVRQWFNDTDLTSYYNVDMYSTPYSDEHDGLSFQQIADYIQNGSFVVIHMTVYNNNLNVMYGHYVTIAGISPNLSQIAISDPIRDITNPTIQYTQHNDAAIVSHDVYTINTTSPVPEEGSWWLMNYDRAQYYAVVSASVVITPIIPNVNPPDKPVKPSGITEGKPGIDYTYTSSTIDPDGDQIFYLFDWSDGTDSGWIGPYESGEEANASYIWNERGDFEIRVKAKDINDLESPWSDPLSVTMPKSHYRFLELLHQFLDIHPLIYRILLILT